MQFTGGHCVEIDKIDYLWACRFNWYINNCGYAARSVREHGKQKAVLLHREILERMGFKDFEEGDHIDRDPSNDKRKNLRVVTHLENSQNRNKQSNNTSGIIGVSLERGKGKYQTHLSHKGKHYHLGNFWNKTLAALIYDKAKHHITKGRGVLNFPELFHEEGSEQNPQATTRPLLNTMRRFFERKGVLIRNELPIKDTLQDASLLNCSPRRTVRG
jgi:hypothetical protein